MTVSDVYSSVIQHMIKGLMTHEQLANYYDFLGFPGYRRCHEYHYEKESKAFRRLTRYFLEHHNMLIPTLPVENPSVIPASWYKYNRNEVDLNTKRSAVKSGLQMWLDWEIATKKLYEDAYKQLVDMGEIASAEQIKCLICDVDEELKTVQQYHLNKRAIDYNLASIVAEQKPMHDKYKKMCKESKYGKH